ncbi:MAG TPA: hypothetical protein VKR60_01930 [Candidatus Sulfotelmatobacter sp.]|nr:hypothetical protein [Candidatus Sulfotelmatobacter sp.]
MKLLRMSSTVVLYLILGIAAPAFAQETTEHQEQKPEQKEEKQEDRTQPDRAQKDERVQKKDEQRAVQGRDERREMKPARIPDDRFRASYGRQHVFHINRVTVVDGAPRFAYGGYTFVMVDAWPAGWYYTDDCYIDYVDGEYFLFDLLHPGVRIAITVVL